MWVVGGGESVILSLRMEEKKVKSVKEIVENTKGVLEPKVSPVLKISFRGQKLSDNAKCIAPANGVSPVLKDSFRGKKPADDVKCIAPSNMVSPVLKVSFREQRPVDDVKCIASSNRGSNGVGGRETSKLVSVFSNHDSQDASKDTEILEEIGNLQTIAENCRLTEVPTLDENPKNSGLVDNWKESDHLADGTSCIRRSHYTDNRNHFISDTLVDKRPAFADGADACAPLFSRSENSAVKAVQCHNKTSNTSKSTGKFCETHYPNKKPKIIVKNERQYLGYSRDAAFPTKVKTSEDTSPPNGKPHPRHLAKNASAVDDHFWTSTIPQPNYIWKGGFQIQVFHGGEKLFGFFDGIQAHLATGASPRALEAVEKLPQAFHFEIDSRLRMWPAEFSEIQAAENTIALYFLAENPKSNESLYKVLVENMIKSDLGLKGNLNGTELLVFSSNLLSERSRGWSNSSFLWGVFRERRVNFPERIPFYVSNSNFSPPNQFFSLPSLYAMKKTCFPGQSNEISFSAGISSIGHPKSNLFTSLACLAISSDKSLDDSKTKLSLGQKLLVPEGNPDQPHIVKDPTRSRQHSLDAPHFGSLQREGKETKGRLDIDLNLQANEQCNLDTECNMEGRLKCRSQGPKLTGDAGGTTRRAVKYPNLLEGNWNDDDSLSLSLALPVFRKHSDVDCLYRK